MVNFDLFVNFQIQGSDSKFFHPDLESERLDLKLSVKKVMSTKC